MSFKQFNNPVSQIWVTKQKNVEDLADSSLIQIKCKYKKVKINFKETSDILKEYLSQSDEENEVISKELQVMIDLYKDSDKICQMLILSIVDKPKEEIMQLLGKNILKILFMNIYF